MVFMRMVCLDACCLSHNVAMVAGDESQGRPPTATIKAAALEQARVSLLLRRRTLEAAGLRCLALGIALIADRVPGLRVGAVLVVSKCPAVAGLDDPLAERTDARALCNQRRKR